MLKYTFDFTVVEKDGVTILDVRGVGNDIHVEAPVAKVAQSVRKLLSSAVQTDIDKLEKLKARLSEADGQPAVALTPVAPSAPAPAAPAAPAKNEPPLS